MPRPAGGNRLPDALRALKRLQVDVLISLLTDEETTALDLEACHASAASLNLDYLRLPIDDHGTPGDARAFVEQLDEVLASGPQTIVCHCWAGIGRSSLTAATLLSRTGADPATILPALGRARGMTVPETPAQARWLREEIFPRGPRRVAIDGR